MHFHLLPFRCAVGPVKLHHVKGQDKQFSVLRQ